ncbi:MAG: GNAT family N-acetyltransferase [Chloroflexota bacterium]
MVDTVAPVRLAPADKARAAAVLVGAFVEDPSFIYVVPEPAERYDHLDRFFRALVDHALRYGRVYTTRDLTGVAVWLPPGGTEANFWQMLRGGFALPRSILALRGEARRRMGDIMNYNDDVHHRTLRGRPHWYLGALGVAADYRGQGIGGSLLRPVLGEADAARVPCFLETQTERNARFYERYGFVVVKEGCLPGYPIRMWALVREPR